MKVLATLLGALVAASAADDDPVQVLMRVRDRILAHAQRIPNHTCVETIVRDWYEFAAGTAPRSCDDLLGRRKKARPDALLRLSSTDRIRLDVALTDSHEIFSWPGAGKFQDGYINELVPTGAIGSGGFAASLVAIFEAVDPQFAFEGEKTVDGRRLFEYSFDVSETNSHYQVRAEKVWLNTGYTGTLLADPATSDLVQLNLRTQELPKSTNTCEVNTTLNYSSVRLNDGDYILPSLVRERFINHNGSEAANAITFSNCREFRAESTLRFDGSSEHSPASVSAGPNPLDLPASLPVTIELTSSIDVDHAGAGDMITGRLAAPILDAQKKNVLIPKGALLEGRLMRVELRYEKTTDLGIALRWDTVELNGEKRPISLLPDWHTASPKLSEENSLKGRTMTFELPRQTEGRYASYHFANHSHGVIAAGLLGNWYTTSL